MNARRFAIAFLGAALAGCAGSLPKPDHAVLPGLSPGETRVTVVDSRSPEGRTTRSGVRDGTYFHYLGDEAVSPRVSDLLATRLVSAFPATAPRPVVELRTMEVGFIRPTRPGAAMPILVPIGVPVAGIIVGNALGQGIATGMRAGSAPPPYASAMMEVYVNGERHASHNAVVLADDTPLDAALATAVDACITTLGKQIAAAGR